MDQHHPRADDSSLELSAGSRGPAPLCARCASLDIGSLLKTHASAAFDEEIKVWEWDDYDHPDWLRKDCAFCELISIIKVPHDTSQAMHWYFSPPSYLYAVDNEKSRPPVPLGLRKAVRRNTTDGLSSIWRDKTGRTNRKWTLFLASRGSVHSQGDLVVRRIDLDRINFDIVKTWLIQTKPQTNLGVDPHVGIPERLIDCRTRKVVPAETHEYAALSYVWGEVMIEFHDVDLGDLLPEVLPNTVEDAITATGYLGYRYLWVDKYCIDQVNGPERMRQINNMDIIFKGAAATIVAASGNDANHGLPGISTRSRKPQKFVQIGSAELMIVSATSVVQDTVSESKWNSRAWTYQEARLSPRLLIFTENELYFESRSGNYRETVEAPFPCLDENLFISQQQAFDPWNANNPEFVSRAIAEYSSRDLSREEDALIAALGFLKEFQNGPNPVYHHWGVPIFPDQAIRLGHGRKSFPYLGPKPPQPFSHEGFLLGLCWRPAGDHLTGHSGKKVRRRLELPSWSWAGWTCTLDADPQSVYEVEHFHAHMDDKVFLELNDGRTVPLKYAYEFHSSEKDMSIFSQYIDLDVGTIPLSLISLPWEDMTISERDRYPEPFALTFEEIYFPFCYGGWGSRTDSFISLVTAEELWTRVLQSEDQPLLGLILGRFEDKRDWPYGMQYILVVARCNGHYERVGYIRQGDRRVQVEVKTLLGKALTRQCIRIG